MLTNLPFRHVQEEDDAWPVGAVDDPEPATEVPD